MKVLITGGAGFIGTNLCERLVQQTGIDEVRVIDDLSTGNADGIAELPVHFTEASILNEAALAEASAGCEAIVHLAALGSVPRSLTDPLASHEANATGTLRVLEAARRNNNAQVVLASSSSVYGANQAIPKVETLECMPMSPYAVSKLATEQYAMAYARCYDLPVLPFRFFNVFGPGQRPGHVYAAVIPVFLEAALNGKPLPVNGDGEQSRDFTYVGTVVSAITTALLGGLTSQPTNLAFGTRSTLNEVIALMGNVLGKDLEVQYRDPRAGDVRHSQADDKRLRALFPDLEAVSLKDGLERTVAWMEQYLANVPDKTTL